MKKILLLVLCASVATAASAQHYKGNVFGIRAGMNATSMSWGEEFPSNVERPAKIGWNAGMSYQRLLSQRLPFYLETGAFLSSKGGKWESSETEGGIKHEQSEAFGITYLQIPLRLSYHFHINEFTLEPFLGAHYAAGLWGKFVGKESVGGSSAKNETKLYKDEDNTRRSDVGMSFGVGATWSNIYAGISWERGFLDMTKGDEKMRNNSNFMITVGYNF